MTHEAFINLAEVDFEHSFIIFILFFEQLLISTTGQKEKEEEGEKNEKLSLSLLPLSISFRLIS